MQILNKILYLLSAQEIKRAILLLLMIIIMAFLEMMGIASVMPFMSVVSNPDIIETNDNLNKIFRLSHKFGIQDEEQFVFVLGVFVFLFLVISLSFKALTTYAQIRFSQLREFSIGKRLIEGYLHQPYSWFLNRHSADFEKNIINFFR